MLAVKFKKLGFVMKLKKIQFFYLLSTLVGCSYGVGQTNNASDICGIEMVKSHFTDLEFSGPFSFTEIEAKYDALLSDFNTNKISQHWPEFKKQSEHSHCLFDFTTDTHSWNSLSGIKGYALIKDGKVIEMFITIKS